jgi:hypothetical protein
MPRFGETLKTLSTVTALVVALGFAPLASANIPKTFRSDSSGTLPAGVKKVSGKVERWVSWQDGRGDNVAIFSQETKEKARKDGERLLSKSLYVTVFAGKDGKMKRVREVRELANACLFDLTNEVRETSVGVTDLDGDGIGELTFAYVTGCRSDVSPLGMKLLVLEGADKHILRGTTRVNTGQEAVGGEFKAELGKRAPASFLEHASKVWAKFVAE